MPTPAQTPHRSGDYDQTRIQDYVARALRALSTVIPFLDGELLTTVGLATTDRVLRHGLKRVPRGLFVVKFSGTTGAIGNVIFRAADTTTVTVRQSAGGTAADFTMWVW